MPSAPSKGGSIGGAVEAHFFLVDGRILFVSVSASPVSLALTGWSSFTPIPREGIYAPDLPKRASRATRIASLGP